MLERLWADLSFYGVFYFDLDLDFEPFFFFSFNFYILFSISERGLKLNALDDWLFIKALSCNFRKEPRLFFAYISIIY
jgi:hypothetical protein